ncbi:BTAD domain-containing putative transcriptional regulator [Streptomyces sp. NPDC057062]|uniref:AfsR/SARP family transcriptional regulator n=1 Tax=Streptomyces sp. NPDC057062 TaxID=3346011 RepID=UPI00362906DC
MEQLRFAVLGPVRAWRGAVEVDLGPPQQRAVLAALLLAEGTQVSMGELIDAVWGTRAPVSAAGTLRTYVHRLRKVLGPVGESVSSVLQSLGRGYRLHIGQDDVDFGVFHRLLARAEYAHDAGHLKEAADHWREALGLWQGSALSGVRGEFADAQRHRLGEQRLSAEAMLMRAEIELGSHVQAAGALVGLVRDHPLDERFRELLMLALYRSGRQAAALATYREAQALLADELGVDPGPGLQEMYQRVLRADGDLLAPAAPARVEPADTPARDHLAATPAQLPADLAAFVGREVELEAASGLVTGDGAAVSVVTGMAGVGKTAFAVHWARQIADAFPDGQIYLNLRGFDHGGPPVASEQALRTALEALGANAGKLPQEVDALAALLRTWLAGRRVLLLLDNARDAAQVRPLLPGAPGCLVIVTSRNQMAGLVAVDGARPVHLDVLSEPEARRFLTRRLGHARTANEPEAVADIVAMCGQLPLALAITAARAATRPAMPLSTIATELHDSAGCLDAFRSGDSAADVRVAFSCSYHALGPDAARLFRLLSLHPGPDTALAATASLGGFSVSHTRHLLDELIQAHLVEERTPGRFALHDLLGAYASELLQATDTQNERDAAHLRLLNHYLHSADNARQFFKSGRDDIDLPAVLPGVCVEKAGSEGGAEAAKRWFNVEHAALISCIGMASRDPQHDAYTWQLAWVIKQYLDRRGRWGDIVTTHRAALDAALRLADPLGEAFIRRGLARATATLGRAEEARAHMARSVELFVETKDPALSSEAHRQAGWLAERLGDIQGALVHAERALELSRASGDAATTARCLNAVGWYHALLGHHERTLQYCLQALPLHQAASDVCGSADTHDSIGYAHHQMGQYEQAVAAYREAVARYRGIDVLFGSADTLSRLGDTYMSMGRPWDAHTAWNEALDVFDALGHRQADDIRSKIKELGADG